MWPRELKKPSINSSVDAVIQLMAEPHITSIVSIFIAIKTQIRFACFVFWKKLKTMSIRTSGALHFRINPSRTEPWCCYNSGRKYWKSWAEAGYWQAKVSLGALFHCTLMGCIASYDRIFFEQASRNISVQKGHMMPIFLVSRRRMRKQAQSYSKEEAPKYIYGKIVFAVISNAEIGVCL